MRLPSVTPEDSHAHLFCSPTWVVPHPILKHRMGQDRLFCHSNTFIPMLWLDGGLHLLHCTSMEGLLSSLVGSCHLEPKATSFARKRQHHTGTDLSVRQLRKDSCPVLIGQSKSCDLPVGMGRWPHTGKNGNVRAFLPHLYCQISFTEIKLLE